MKVYQYKIKTVTLCYKIKCKLAIMQMIISKVVIKKEENQLKNYLLNQHSPLIVLIIVIYNRINRFHQDIQRTPRLQA